MRQVCALEDFICKLVESVCILECASAALSGEWVFAWGWVVLHESGSTCPG